MLLKEGRVIGRAERARSHDYAYLPPFGVAARCASNVALLKSRPFELHQGHASLRASVGFVIPSKTTQPARY